MNNALTLTDAAAERVRSLMEKAPADAIGLRIGVSSKGCSGLSYDVKFTTEAGKLDEVVDAKGVKVILDSAAVMFLLGSEMDYKDDKFHSGFVFNNPNEKGRCGCGESFHV